MDGSLTLPVNCCCCCCCRRCCCCCCTHHARTGTTAKGCALHCKCIKSICKINTRARAHRHLRIKERNTHALVPPSRPAAGRQSAAHVAYLSTPLLRQSRRPSSNILLSLILRLRAFPACGTARFTRSSGCRASLSPSLPGMHHSSLQNRPTDQQVSSSTPTPKQRAISSL